MTTKYIVEIMPAATDRYPFVEQSVFGMSAEYLFKDQAEKVAEAYRELGCITRILKVETIYEEVRE
jgi:hypothetical protein